MMLMRLKVDNFLQLGANLSFLSAFPAEGEVCFPPLTYLRPSECTELEVDGHAITIIDVHPYIG